MPTVWRSRVNLTVYSRRFRGVAKFDLAPDLGPRLRTRLRRTVGTVFFELGCAAPLARGTP